MRDKVELLNFEINKQELISYCLKDLVKSNSGR